MTYYFCFSLVPFISVFLRAVLSKKVIGIIGITAAIFCMPILFGYQYTAGAVHKFAFFMMLTCLTSFVLNEIDFKQGILFSALIFVLMGLLLWPKVLGAGKLTKEKEWVIENYKIEHFSDQGFAGPPSLYYKLSKYGSIPFFVKELENTFYEDSIDHCIIRFPENKLIFNKCQVTIGEM